MTLEEARKERKQKERKIWQADMSRLCKEYYPDGVYRGEVNMAKKTSKKNGNPTRKELMALCQKKGVKNFWPMTKEELVECANSKTSKEKIAALSKKALARSRAYLKK